MSMNQLLCGFFSIQIKIYHESIYKHCIVNHPISSQGPTVVDLFMKHLQCFLLLSPVVQAVKTIMYGVIALI